MGDRSIPILPDSTGKRIIIHHHTELNYDGAAGPGAFSLGNTVTGQGSGFVGVVNKIKENGTAGTIILTPNAASEALDFTDDENLLVGGSTIAQANGIGFPIYAQGIQVIGYDEPYQGLRIDPRGAAFTRFAEGAPQLDAFGRLSTSETTTLGDYIHQYSILPELYFDEEIGSATVVHESGSGGVVLECSTSDGDRATRTTHKYHTYQAGKSHLVEMTLAHGDTGKDNVVRRWGYYDDSDGTFFELSGTTLQTVLRRSVDGVIGEERVIQTSFNADVLDGSSGPSNLSRANLDVSKNNIYWIDLQWLGAGRVRYGVNIDGQRLVAHELQNANSRNNSYMRTATLPLRYEQINSGTAASVSQMRFFCATVATESPFAPRENPLFASRDTGEVSPGDSHHRIVFNQEPGNHMLTIRARQQLAGQTNRIAGVPQGLHVAVRNDSSSSISVRLYRSASFTGSMTWQTIADGGFESSLDGEVLTGSAGTPLGAWVANPGTDQNIDVGSLFPPQGNNSIRLGADGTDQQSFAFTIIAHNFAADITSSAITATFANSPVNVLSRSTGDFETDGFVGGQGIYVSGSVDNDAYFVIDAVMPLSMTFRVADVPETEGPTSNVVVKGGNLSFLHTGLNFKEIF